MSAVPPPPSMHVPPPPGPATSAGSRTVKAIVGVIVASCVAFVGLVFGLIPLLFLVPSFWLSALISLAAVVVVLFIVAKSLGSRWIVGVGVALFLVPLVLMLLRPLGGDPINPKPQWTGPSWQGTDVAYWDLSTGSRIGYVRFAPDVPNGAAPVVFLHGGPGGGIVPIDGAMAQTLADDGYDVYLYDQAGVGWSGLLEIDEYTVDRMVADLEAIRTEIGSDTINLVGHSWGGALAARYLAAHDDRVDRAWLSNPGEFGGTYEKDESVEPDLTAGSDGIPLNGVPPLRLGLAFLLSDMGAKPGAVDDLVSQEQVVRYIPDYVDVVSTFQGNRCAANPYEPAELAYVPSTNFNLYVLTYLSSDLASLDPIDGLSGIETPMVIARGVCDFIPWEAQRAYREHVPGAQLVVIADEGHDMRPTAEISSFFATGDPGLPAYLADEVPSPR